MYRFVLFNRSLENLRSVGARCLRAAFPAALGMTFALAGTASAQETAPTQQEPVPLAQATPEGEQAPQQPPLFNIGEEVNLAEFAYQVSSATWRMAPEGQVLGGMPLKENLIVELRLRNQSDEKQDVPSFVLIDETGEAREAVAPVLDTPEGPIVLDELLPGGPIQAKLYFNVPKGRSYRLQVTGADWSTQSTLVPLETEPGS